MIRIYRDYIYRVNIILGYVKVIKFNNLIYGKEEKCIKWLYYDIFFEFFFYGFDKWKFLKCVIFC